MRLNFARRYAGAGVLALAAGLATPATHSDNELSNEIRLGMRAFGDAGLTIYTPGGAMPDPLSLGVVTTIVPEPDAPFTTLPTVRSVIVALGGELELNNGVPEIVDSILEVEPEFWTGDPTSVEYRMILDGATLPFTEQDVGGNPGLVLHESLRSLAVADSYYFKGQTTTEVKGRLIDVTILDAALADGDGNGIPDATALLDSYALLMGLDGTVTFIYQLGNATRGEPPFDSTKFILDTATGIIEIDTRIPRLDQIISRDPVTYSGFTTGRFLVTVSPDIASLIDAPAGADPLAEFDLTNGGAEAPPPRSLFVRTILALADDTLGGTPAWTFVEILPGNLTIDVRVTGLGVANILEDGMPVYGYEYGITPSQTGEDILTNQNNDGWAFGTVAVLSRLNEEAARRGAVTPISGDDSVEFTGPRATGIFGSNVMPELRGNGGGGGGGCFIATAAYGTPLAMQIQSLRELRDGRLMNSALGVAFVDAYYRMSPPIAQRIAESNALRSGVRVVVTAVVRATNSPQTTAAVVFAVLLCAGTLATKLRRTRGKSTL